MEHGRVKFEKVDEKWKCIIIDKDHVDFNDSNTIDAVAFMIGNLKFLCKENFDGQWCYLCSLFYPEWQKEGHTCGTPWTLDGFKAQALQSQDENGKERMGVREDPYFDIPVEIYIYGQSSTLLLELATPS